jgi:hypothetical protein
LNVAADPAAKVPGLMVATTRALFKHIQADGPALLLGVTNEKSFQGFVRMLGFRRLGPLSLTFHPPGTLPQALVPRALSTNTQQLTWRTRRPGVPASGHRGRGALLARLHHHRIPIDAVLTTGLQPDAIESLGLGDAAVWTPRLYASFGGAVRGGVPVPHRLRPSPLEYVFRVLGDPALTEPMARHLAVRRFEFLDFDVV